MSSPRGYYTLQNAEEGTTVGLWGVAKSLSVVIAVFVGVVGISTISPPATVTAVQPASLQRPLASIKDTARAPRAVVPEWRRAADAVPAAAEPFHVPVPSSAGIAATTAAVTFLGPVGEAGAALEKGRTFALLHPASMFALLMLSLWTGWLGLQWRRTRTLGQEIAEAKAQISALAAKLGPATLQGTAKETLAALSAQNQAPSAADREVLQSIMALEGQVDGLQKERKALAAENFRDRHYGSASWVLAVGVSSAVVGPVNTYIRTGKLFPGPHLYVGAAMVSCWAVAAALVPAMQKGNDTARSAHIALNTVNVALFAWQVVTGIQIVFKVFEFTKWP